MAIIQKSFSDLVDFTRGSTATYTDATGIIRTAAIDEPRFTYDPVTGEALGLLMEGQSTNLCSGSNSLGSTSYWPRYGNLTITPGFEPSPVEGESGIRLQVEPGIDARIDQVIPVSEGEQITLSFWAKTGPEAATSQLQIFDPESWENRNISTTSTWKRFVFTGVVPEGRTSFTARFRRASSLGLDVVIFGVQVEVGSYPTSYIPTGGSQVTRAADLTTMPMPQLDRDEGTFILEVDVTGLRSLTRGFATAVMSIGGPDRTDTITLMITGNDRQTLQVTGYPTNTYGSVSFYDILIGIDSGFVRVAFAYQRETNTYRLACAGQVMSGSPANSIPIFAADPTLMINRLGIQGETIYSTSKKYKSVTYFPRALTDTQLQELTK